MSFELSTETQEGVELSGSAEFSDTAFQALVDLAATALVEHKDVDLFRMLSLVFLFICSVPR